MNITTYQVENAVSRFNSNVELPLLPNARTPDELRAEVVMASSDGLYALLGAGGDATNPVTEVSAIAVDGVLIWDILNPR